MNRLPVLAAKRSNRYGLFYVLPSSLCLCILCLSVFLVVGSRSAAAKETFAAQPLKESAPKDVAEPVRAVLSAKGLRILDENGKPYVDLWLRKTLTTQPDPGKLGIDYGVLMDGDLLGAARFHGRSKDFRGRSFKAGVYTLRKLTQPEDGDHLGVSETRDFVLLCASDGDKEPIKLDPKKAVELSCKVSGNKHPSVLYLLKLFTEPKDQPHLFENEDLQYWVLDCQIPNAAAGQKAVRLGLVLVGEAPEA